MNKEEFNKKAEEFAASNCPCGNRCEVDRILVAACKMPKQAYLAGAKERDKWWAKRWQVLDAQIGNCCGRHPFDAEGIRICKEFDQVVEEVEK